jgi:hypothetical protein
MSNQVDHPAHYQHPSGVEAIDICEHLGFNLGNAYKYLARAGKKGDAATDLRKAAWYLSRDGEKMRIATRGGGTLIVPGLVRALARKVMATGAEGAAHRMMLLAVMDGVIQAPECFAIAKECEREATAREVGA